MAQEWPSWAAIWGKSDFHSLFPEFPLFYFYFTFASSSLGLETPNLYGEMSTPPTLNKEQIIPLPLYTSILNDNGNHLPEGNMIIDKKEQ